MNNNHLIIAIQDEINQYKEGNLTYEQCINGILELINDNN